MSKAKLHLSHFFFFFLAHAPFLKKNWPLLAIEEKLHSQFDALSAITWIVSSYFHENQTFLNGTESAVASMVARDFPVGKMMPLLTKSSLLYSNNILLAHRQTWDILK